MTRAEGARSCPALFAEQNVLILFVLVAFHNFGSFHVALQTGQNKAVEPPNDIPCGAG